MRSRKACQESALEAGLDPGAEHIATTVELDRDLSVGEERKVPPKPAAKPLEVVRREHGRRAAAEVNVAHRVNGAERLGHQLDLAKKDLEVATDRAVAARHRGMTAAIPAEALAERHVQVERQRRLRRQRGKPAAVVVRRDASVEVRRRRVACIALHRTVVFGQEFGSHAASFGSATARPP